MTMAWTVWVTAYGREEEAEANLRTRGFEVWLPRNWARAKINGKWVGTYELRMPPYLYVQMDLNGLEKDDNQQLDMAKAERGVLFFLRSAGSVRPATVPAGLIKDHREREEAERARRPTKRGIGRADLVLGGKYRIVRGLAQGQIGELFDFSRAMAFMDIDGKKVEVCDADLELIPAEQKQKRRA